MKIRVIEKERILRDTVQEGDDKHTTIRYVYKPHKRYYIQYEIIKTNWRGKEINKGWSTIVATNDKEEAKRCFDWYVSNNTIGDSREVLHEETINPE